MSNIIFYLGNDLAISMAAESGYKKDSCCSEVSVLLASEKEKFLITVDFLDSILKAFIGKLDRVLNNEAFLHSSINTNIGYFWNEILHFEVEPVEVGGFWVGDKNLLCETPGNIKPNLATWLYNEQGGDIILEITPVYEWHNTDPEQGELFITYEEFMKDYKSIFKQEVSRDIAEEWLKQARDILDSIEQ